MTLVRVRVLKQKSSCMNSSEHVYNGSTDKFIHFLTSCFCSNQAISMQRSFGF